MSIRTKTTLFIVLVVGALVGLIATIHSRTSLDRFGQIEDAQMQADVDRVVLQIQSAGKNLQGTNSDWSYWDDTYVFVQDGNTDYVDNNLYVEAFVPIAVDLVAFVDADGNVVYDNWFRGVDEVPVPDEVLESARPGGLLGEFSDPLAANGGIVVVDGVPLLLSSRAVLTSTFEGPPMGVLVMGREISDTFVANISALTNLDVSVTPCEPGTCATTAGDVFIEKASDEIFGETIVNGLDGEPVLTFGVNDSRETYSAGAAGIRRVLIITISVGAAAALLSIVLARRVLVGRLEGLNETVLSVGERRDHTTRVAVEGRDEIGSLAAGINEMLEGLEQAQVDLVAAKDEIERGSEAKSRFLSRLSHEVRNPLNGVIGYAQLLEMDQLDDEQSHTVKQILVAGSHITSLLEEFLDIARIEAGVVPLDLQPTNIAQVVTDAVELSRPAASQRSITLRQSGDAHDFAIADELRLRQVLLNLISNAIKYGNDDDFVAIHHESNGEQQILTVTDNGPGIREEHLDRIFVPFDRLDADASSVVGAGVGLTVTKQLIELMGGSIRVESQIDNGTRFTIALPAASVASDSAGVAPNESHADRSTV